MPNFGEILSNINMGENPLMPQNSGTATLVLGTVDVVDGNVTANSVIVVSRVGNTGILDGVLRISSTVVGVGFTVTSSSLIDTGDIAWIRMEPIIG